MADLLTQNSRVFQSYGGFVFPVLPVRLGQSTNQATTTTAGTEINLTTKLGGCDRIVRIFAIGAPVYYVLGLTGLGVPGVGDGYVPQDQWLDDIVYLDLPFIRFIAVSGTGTARVQIMG